MHPHIPMSVSMGKQIKKDDDIACFVCDITKEIKIVAKQGESIRFSKCHWNNIHLTHYQMNSMVKGLEKTFLLQPSNLSHFLKGTEYMSYFLSSTYRPNRLLKSAKDASKDGLFHKIHRDNAPGVSGSCHFSPFPVCRRI